jgi:hypothetical protein
MGKEFIQKRKDKSQTLEAYLEEKEKNKKPKNSAPVRLVNIDRRHHFMKPTEKMEKLDVNVAHFMKEIKTLPYSHELDNIGNSECLFLT